MDCLLYMLCLGACSGACVEHYYIISLNMVLEGFFLLKTAGL